MWGHYDASQGEAWLQVEENIDAFSASRGLN